MRHKSYSTTQIYISIARQMVEAVESLHVPDVLKKKGMVQMKRRASSGAGLPRIIPIGGSVVFASCLICRKS